MMAGRASGTAVWSTRIMALATVMLISTTCGRLARCCAISPASTSRLDHGISKTVRLLKSPAKMLICRQAITYCQQAYPRPHRRWQSGRQVGQTWAPGSGPKARTWGISRRLRSSSAKPGKADRIEVKPGVSLTHAPMVPLTAPARQPWRAGEQVGAAPPSAAYRRCGYRSCSTRSAARSASRREQQYQHRACDRHGPAPVEFRHFLVNFEVPDQVIDPQGGMVCLMDAHHPYPVGRFQIMQRTNSNDTGSNYLINNIYFERTNTSSGANDALTLSGDNRPGPPGGRPARWPGGGSRTGGSAPRR